MNDRDERLIAGLAKLEAGQAEHKRELVAIVLHLERLNGSVAKHFADDLAWQQAHDRREVARELGLVEEAAEARGYRRGLMFPIAAVVAVTGFAGGALGPVLREFLF